MDTKQCRKCREVKPVSEFTNRKSNRDGKYSYCKGCKNADRLEYHYCISQAQYQALLESQRGVCAICCEPCPTGRRLAVDHDHACCPGKRSCGECVRSLLCDNCNPLLGLAKDNQYLLRKAADYLDNPPLYWMTNAEEQAFEEWQANQQRELVSASAAMW